MKKATYPLITSAISCLVLFQSPLSAYDAPKNETKNSEVVESTEGHAPVGSVAMDPKVAEEMRKRRAQEEKEDQSQDPAKAASDFKQASAKVDSHASSFTYASSRVTDSKASLVYYPVNSHRLASVASNSTSLEIEDGSHWEVSAFDAYTLATWAWGDPLVVSPINSWFSGYTYYITNQRTFTSVKANLYIGPVAYGENSQWITDIDYENGYVWLSNGMVWVMSLADAYLYKTWTPNQHVITGNYSSWFSNYDHILINVENNNFVYTKQY